MACIEKKTIENPFKGKSTNERIAEVIKNEGNELIKEIKIKNATVSMSDNYTTEDAKDVNVYLNIDDSCPTKAKDYVLQDDMTYALQETGQIKFTLFDITGYIANQNSKDAFLAKHIIRHPRSLESLLTDSVIDVVQMDIKKGNPIISIFSTKEKVTARTYDNNTMSNNLAKLTFSQTAEAKIEKIDNAILGI